jgi:hypothetical protein
MGLRVPAPLATTANAALATAAVAIMPRVVIAAHRQTTGVSKV